MVHNLLFLLVSFMFQCGEVNQAVLLVIFPDGTRTEGATLYPDDRTQRSQEHRKEKESKVETNANKGRSRGNEAMADPSSGSSHCSSGDDSVYGFTDKETEEESTSSPADDVTSKDCDTKAETTKPSRSSMDETTLKFIKPSKDEESTLKSESSPKDRETTSTSSSQIKRRPCSLHHPVPTGTQAPFITNVLNNAKVEDVVDSNDVDLNGDIDDDRVGLKELPSIPAKSHMVDVVPPLATRCHLRHTGHTAAHSRTDTIQ